MHIVSKYINLMSESEKEQFEDSEGLTPSERRMIEMNFSACLLDADVGNALVPASMMVAMGNFEAIKPFQTYEEYLREKSTRHPNPDAYYNAVMKRSDMTLVKEYNTRIFVFNEGLEEIKRKRDAKRIQDFVQEMSGFLKAEKK